MMVHHNVFSRFRAATLALLLVLANVAVLPSPAFAMTSTNGTYQPVWCQITGNVWTAQIGSSGPNNPNRFPLTEVPAGALDDLYIDATSGQVYAPDSSDDTLKGELDSYCQAQYVIAVPQVTIAPVCGMDNDAITAPASDIYNVAYSPWTDGSATVTVTIIASGYTFADGSRVATYPVTELDRSKCTETIAMPVVPVVDACGLDNATYGDVPSGQYTFVRNADGSLTFTANDGYVFTDGSTVYTLVAPVDSGALCVVESPEPPMIEDVCGIDNATWIIPADTAYYKWVLAEDNSLHAVITDANYSFADGQTSLDFGVAPDSQLLCAPAPNFNDASCDMMATITIPESDYYMYLIQWNNDEPVSYEPGTYIFRSPSTVKVYAYVMYESEEYQITDEWTHSFASPVDCTPGKGSITPTPVVKTPVTTNPIAASVLPAELPETGGVGFNGIIVSLAAALATYGAIYFASKRHYE